jgi:hypothetical protein
LDKYKYQHSRLDLKSISSTHQEILSPAYQSYFGLAALQNFRMSSLPKRFVIIVDGQHVTKPEHDHNEIRPAEVGDKSSAATFELQGDTLVSGDWALGCSKLAGQVANHFRVPASVVVWFRKDQAQELYPVLVEEGEDGPQLRFARL